MNSFFWQAPDRILLIEYVGGGRRDFGVAPGEQFSTRQSGKDTKVFTRLATFRIFAVERR